MQVRDIDPTLQQQGIRSVVVGNGPPQSIARLRERTGYQGPVLTDPSTKLHKALGFRGGLREALDPRTVLRAVSALGRGARQERVQGRPFQQGGVLLVRADASLAWYYLSRYAGDHPSSRKLLKALVKAT